MANIKKLKANGQDIVPITHEQAVLDSNGVTLDSKLNAINNAISRLENNSTSNAPSLVGNTLTFGNYTIKYNETDDTLDFIYNGTTDEPVVPPTSDSYVTEGLSMYIDATRGSINDIIGNNTITNHGVTHTSDNNYLNFVGSESDYLDTDLLPNLSTWSAELYFYFTEAPIGSQVILGWGSAGENKFRIAYSKSYLGLVTQSNTALTRVISTESNLLEPHHLIVTKNNGVVISYLDGVKTELCTDDPNQSSQAGTLKIGTKYDASTEFANINLRMVRFYDGKVLTDEEALQNYNYEIKNNYVTNGLSLYIDANDAAAQGSIRDITSKQSIVNHGVSTTLNNGCLNFVASESDYIDTGLVPNLTTWSTEVYFYYTSSPTETQAVYSWGDSSSNRVRLGYSASGGIMKLVTNSSNGDMNAIDNYLTLRHIVFTADNGTFLVYIDGVKQYEFTGRAYNAHTGTLKIGTGLNASTDFANMNLRMFRHYDGKVLSADEVLQNYNYELNRGVIKPTWIYNKKPDSSTGQLIANEGNACTEFIVYDNSYNYTLAIDTVEFFRVFYYDSSQSYIKNDSIANNFNGMITPPENTAYMRLKLARKAVEFADLDNHVIFRKTHK